MPNKKKATALIEEHAVSSVVEEGDAGVEFEGGETALAQHPSGEGTMHNKDLGRRGEDAAAAFLERRGFDILERNWTCRAGEADIIAQDEDAIHFVEVKTRMSDCCGFPAEAVDANKRRRYERIAELYLTGYEGPDIPITFDIVSILVTGEHRAFLRMHRNVFSNDCI